MKRATTWTRQLDAAGIPVDLADYLANEFHLPRQPDLEPAHIAFWSELASGADNDELSPRDTGEMC